VAHQFGYHDQMHMIHDFGEFTGETPRHRDTHKTLGQLRSVFSGRLLTVRWTETSETDDGGPGCFSSSFLQR
jgi:hypothetical protein